MASGAGAVLHLQRAAGNRAVTRMLAGAASGAGVRASDLHETAAELPTSLSVQRQMLDKGISDNTNERTDQLWFNDFAVKLIAKVKEPASTAKETGSVKQKTAGTGKAGATGTAEFSLPSIATAKQLEDRETQLKEQARILRGDLTEDEKKRQEKSKELDLLEEQQKQAARPLQIQEELKAKQRELQEEQREVDARITKLQQGLTPAEEALRNKKEELDVLEEQQKETGKVEETSRKRALQARLLNPKKKNLSQLQGGRMF
jgi:hypothetical protein